MATALTVIIASMIACCAVIVWAALRLGRDSDETVQGMVEKANEAEARK